MAPHKIFIFAPARSPPSHHRKHNICHKSCSSYRPLSHTIDGTGPAQENMAPSMAVRFGELRWEAQLRPWRGLPGAGPRLSRGQGRGPPHAARTIKLSVRRPCDTPCSLCAHDDDYENLPTRRLPSCKGTLASTAAHPAPVCSDDGRRAPPPTVARLQAALKPLSIVSATWSWLANAAT